MTWTRSILVVANVTATSDQLVAALESQARGEPTRFTLVIPATPFGGGREAALQQLSEATERLQATGLEVDGSVGNGDPIVAVTEAWDPKLYDEIIVSTLPIGSSKWLHAGLPERVRRMTGAPVTHLIAEPLKPEAPTVAAPVHEKRLLGPLTVLTWGGHKDVQ
jgi:hypothetical protein